MFDTLPVQPADPLLSLIAAFDADPRPHRIDLGVGVYRDEHGATPVMGSVKAAEQRLWQQQDSKSYLGAEGDTGFVAAIRRLALGDAHDAARIAGLQTPGGTGALRLALELYVRNAPDGTVWIGTPTWPVHETMLQGIGARVQTYAAYDREAQAAVPGAISDAAARARRGDLFLLHGCCHNPTGAVIDAAEWPHVAALFAERGILPLVDLAYQGLGAGLDEDVAGLRMLAGTLPRVLLAYSCDKNLGVYRDRVGAVYALCSDAGEAAVAKGNLARLARNAWSMPPDHGGAVVRIVMEDAALAARWRAELETMRRRLLDLRAAVAAYGRIGPVDLARLTGQEGMFAMLPLGPDAIVRLREQHAIYMAGNGRINLAGLTMRDIPVVVRALKEVVGS